jgi:hypothetical protein
MSEGLILFKTTFFRRSKVVLEMLSFTIGEGAFPQLIKKGGITNDPKLAFPRNEMNDRLLCFI